MSWKYSRRRREDEDKEDEYPDFFDFGFGRSFGEIDELINNVFRKAASEGKEVSSFGPIYYGYSVTIGPDGKPNVREFGNVKPSLGGRKLELGIREPFVDTVIDEKEGVIKIIAEMPGVRKEDIKLEVVEDSVKISTEDGERRYETRIPINVPIEPEKTSASYNNGVLEIIIRMKETPRAKGFSVRVD